MKQLNFSIPFFNLRHLGTTLATALFLMSGNVFAQFSGNYTIDPSQSASSTNYLDMKSAVKDLNGLGRSDGGPDNHNGVGVTGAVVFTFASGYSKNEQIEIKSITGTSSSNTVTFEGNGANIYYAGTSGSRHTIWLNGVSYVTLNDMYIQGTDGYYAYVVRFSNKAQYNVLDGCTVEASNVDDYYPYYYSQDASACIAFTSSSDYIDYYGYGSSYGNNGYGNVIQNCIIKGDNTKYGPTFGIFDVEEGSNYNSFINNQVYDFSTVGIYTASTDGEEISGNDIFRTSNVDIPYWNEVFGIRTDYPVTANNKDIVIENNKIHEIQGKSSNLVYNAYGLYFYTGGYSSSQNQRIINNSIYNNAAEYNYGVLIQYPWNMQFFNNTIAMDNTDGGNGETYATYFYHYTSANNEIRNNNVSMTEGGSGNKWGYFIDYKNYFTESHNNAYINTGGSNYYGYFGSQCSDFTEWVNNGGSTSDMDQDPSFLDPSNGQYECINFVMNNSGANLGVTTDINGNARNVAQPDRGAYEVILDFSAIDANFLVNNVCAGYTDNVKFTIENNSDYDLKGVELVAELNSVVNATGKVNTVIPAHTQYQYTFSNPTILSNSGSNTLKIYIKSDDDGSNNVITRVINVKPAPGGGVVTQKSGSKGIFSYNGLYDVVAEGDKIEYLMSAPSKYTDAGYGTDWTGSMFMTTASGTPVGGISTYAHNSTIEMSITAPVAYIDSTLIMNIQINDLQNGCDTTYKRKVLIAPKGKPSFAFPTIICDNDLVLFDNLSTVHSGFLTYEWDFNDGSPIDDAVTPVHKFPGTGTYNVKLTAITSPFGFTTEKTISVSVNEVPKTKFTRVNACDGTPVTFTNNTTISSGGLIYDWDFGDNTAHSSAVSPSHVYAQVNGYTVTLKATSVKGCVNTQSKNVYTFARPVANFTAPSGSVCVGTPVVLPNNSTISNGNAGSYWSFGDGETSTNATGMHPYMTEGTYNVKLKMISEYGCSDSITKPVSIKPAPVASFTYDRACSNDPTSFTNTTTYKAGQTPSYTWEFSDGNNASTPNTVHMWTTKGIKNVKLTALQPNGCSNFVEKQINVLVQPNAQFTVNDGCSGKEVAFENQTTVEEGELQSQWQFGDNTTSNLSDPVHTYTTSTTRTYNIVLVSSVGGCDDSAFKTVTISESPVCDFTFKRDYRYGYRGYVFTPDNTTYSEYTWEFGDGSSSSTVSPTYTYAIDGRFVAKLKAKNALGCDCEKTVTVGVEYNTDVQDIENLFSVVVYPNPNNGQFIINIEGFTDEGTTIVVYNALGEVVKTIHNADNSTDVDLSGEATGIYIVKVSNKGHVVTRKITVSK